MIYREELIGIEKRLCSRREDLIEEMKSLPQGELMIIEQSGTKKYLQRLPAVGNRKKERRYGVKRKPDVLNALVRKAYIVQALKIIEEDIRTIKNAEKEYIPCDENAVMESFLKRNPELEAGIHRGDFDGDEWKERFGRIEGYHSDNLRQTAADGTRMRSKNEVYIASRLDHYKLLYRSDCPTGIPGLYRVPDFTIIRKRDKKIIYWEHMGMMDELEYRIDSKRKLEEYEAAGIVPWDNLIITYDTKKGGLRADLIEAMIQGWLL